jgi:molecular chaperone GrpE
VNDPEDDRPADTAAPSPEAAGPAEAVSEPGHSATTLADALTSPAEHGAENAEEMSVYRSYEQRARLAEDRLAEVLTAFRALKAETESHRERITKNLDRRYDQRRDRLLLKFIDILDNLDRALEAAEQTSAGEPLIEGLILVRTSLLQTLKDEGLERIPALGFPFDPRVAEGVSMEAVADPDRHDVVIKELQRGYLIGGRVARVARVVIGQYKAPPDEVPPEEAAPPAAEGPVAETTDDAPAETAAPLAEPPTGSETGTAAVQVTAAVDDAAEATTPQADGDPEEPAG